MSENRDEKYRKLREEINLLKEQLLRITDELEEEPSEPQTQEEPISIDIEDTRESEEIHEQPEDLESEKEDETSYRYKRMDPERYTFRPPFMDKLGEYIEDFVEDVMEGVVVGLEESLFINPRYPRHRQRVRPERKLSNDEIKTTADKMGALANEHRVKILNELSYGGLYSSDFQNKLHEISPSTLSSHLDVLEDAGFIVQERRRGRYVITLAGRVAVQMAHQVSKLTRKAKNHQNNHF